MGSAHPFKAVKERAGIIALGIDVEYFGGAQHALDKPQPAIGLVLTDLIDMQRSIAA